MRLTRERKIILSVLAVAVAALLFDQLFSGSSTPSPAAAQAAAAPAKPTEDAAQAAVPAISTTDADSLGRPSVAQQLASISDKPELAVDQITDAFRPSAGWESSDSSANTPVAKALPGRAGEVFADEHSLSGVIKTDSGGYAIINGQVVGLGNTLDGFRLVAMADNWVRMESKGIRVVLRLDRSSPPANRQESLSAEHSFGSSSDKSDAPPAE